MAVCAISVLATTALSKGWHYVNGYIMDYFKEEEFYKEGGSPTEYFLYCSYIFLQQSEPEWGKDYNQFALVGNAEYPYIRLTRKRGQCHYPSGGSSKIAIDGSFARKTDEERDAECPKIAW